MTILKLINNSQGDHTTKRRQFCHVHVVWNPGETLEWRAILEFHVISNPRVDKASNSSELIS